MPICAHLEAAYGEWNLKSFRSSQVEQGLLLSHKPCYRKKAYGEKTLLSNALQSFEIPTEIADDRII